ncbi:MAG: hypothetical protein GY832_35725 [Chloroflexi bacterium]|nr:hypothetical protein [Chloroflexota bacterium]
MSPTFTPSNASTPTSTSKHLPAKKATRQGILDGLEWLQGRVTANSNTNPTINTYKD